MRVSYLLRILVQFLCALALISVAKLAFADGADSQVDRSTIEYREIQWTDLLPPDDLEALMNPPDYLDDIVDGSPEDQLLNEMTAKLPRSGEDRYQQALASTKVRQEYDKQNIKIPGFIVPLEFDDNLIVTEFFLVPFFGACIHVPPPPPNQIIYIQFEQGIRLDNMYDPFYIEGKLIIDTHDAGGMGKASYSMDAYRIYAYTR